MIIQRSLKLVVITVFFSASLLCLLLSRNVDGSEKTSPIHTRNIPKEDQEKETCISNTDPSKAAAIHPLKPHRALLGPTPTELYYMLPSDLPPTHRWSGGITPRAIIIFFHGCNHSGADTFLLPEDRRVAFSALRRGFAVVSPSSTNRNGDGCWNRYYDMDSLPSTFAEFKNRVGLSDGGAYVPVFGMGASSGGYFLFKGNLAGKMGFRALASYVSLGPGASKPAASDRIVPTVFVYMERDRRNQYLDRVRGSMRPVVTEAFAVEPSPFDVSVCQERIPEIADVCGGVVEELLRRRPGLLDPETFELLREPVSPDMDVLGEVSDVFLVGGDEKDGGVLPDRSFHGRSWAVAAVEQELAHAYAQHEMSSEYIEEVLDFFEDQVQLSN